MLDQELKANVIKDAVLLKLVGFKPIIVHGGGKEISRWVNKVGMEPDLSTDSCHRQRYHGNCRKWFLQK